MNLAKPASARELVQRALVSHLNEHHTVWTAPYGVIESTRDLPRGGKIRNVTWGVARLLDAHATIWSVDKIVVQATGPVATAWDLDGTYASVDDLLEKLVAIEQHVRPSPSVARAELPGEPGEGSGSGGLP